MSTALLLGGFLYARAIWLIWAETGELASPSIPQVLAYTAIVVVIAIIGHVGSAALAPADTNAPADERERAIFNRAANFSSACLVGGVLISLGVYVFSNSGDLLFYTVFASLMISHILDYLLQIFFFKTSP